MPQRIVNTSGQSHVAPILPTDVEQRIRDLTQAGDLDGLHQFLKHVPALSCHLLELGERGLRGLAFHRLSVNHPLQAGFLLLGRRTSEFHLKVVRSRFVKGSGVGVLEGIHADNGQRTVVLEDPDAASMVNSVRQAMVDQIREHFAPELRGMSSSRREGAVAVIATLTSVESWEQFRETYGRSVRQTRRGWVDAVTAALGEASVR